MRIIFQISILIIFIISSSIVFALELNGEQIIKSRKSIFKQNYSYAKKMTAEIEIGNKEKVRDLAIKMSENYSKLKDYFPENSKSGYDTEALPIIWEEKENFNNLIDRASKNADEFSKLVFNLIGDDLKDYQKKMIWSQCKTCHDKFRMPH